MRQSYNSYVKSRAAIGLLIAVLSGSSLGEADIQKKSAESMVVWDDIDASMGAGIEREGSTPKGLGDAKEMKDKGAMKANRPDMQELKDFEDVDGMNMKQADEYQESQRRIIDGFKTQDGDMPKGPSESGYMEKGMEKYLETTSPPAKVSKIVDIYLENKSKPQGFLTGFTTKRADIDLKLRQHQPSDIPLDAKFQIANFGNYIRLGHESTGRLIGYSTNYFGFTSVYLEKDYYESRDFWTRFKIAPSGKEDWYLLRSYTNPKKCLTIGWSEKLRLKRCNIKDKWQQWRFLREKADAYWIPDADLINLDII